MPKLYLVGITEDRSGLVLAKSSRAKKGDSVLEVDHVVLDALAEIRRYRSEGTTRPSISSPALPSRRSTAGEVSTASALSPREIQARLRKGESAASVARRAGIEEWRVAVYATPITAEQTRVVTKARDLFMVKRGSGASGRPLGESVQANIIDKRLSMNVDEFEGAWSAYEPEPDRWVVVFEYVSRGTRHRAEWVYDDDDPDTILPVNRMATTLGWRDPRRTGKLLPLPEAPRVTTAKKPAKRRRRPAARTPATKPPPRSVTTKGRSAKKAPAKKTAARKAPAKKTAAKKAPAKKTAAKKTAARKAPAKKVARGRTPAKAKTPTRTRSTKRSAARPSKPTKAVKGAKKAPAKKTAANKTAANKTARRPAQPRHLRIVEPPADAFETEAPARVTTGATGAWRRDADRRRSTDPGPTRRSWREQAARDPAADRDLAPPEWLGDTPRRQPASEAQEREPFDEPRVARSRGGSAADITRQVSVDATRVTGRRRGGLRRRDRPLRSH